jgi:ABC-2 type transport system permease protein
MNQFLGFVKKEFTHIFRDSRTMIILFGIPIIQLMLFGYVITTEIKDARIAILDHSNDNVTREIKNKILSSGYFRLEANLLQENEISQIFKKGDVKQVIVFERDFAQRLEREGKANIQVIADASDPNTAQMLYNYTNGIVQDYTRKKYAGFTIPVQIKSEVRMLYNESMVGAFMFVPGTMALILMLISAMMTSITIAREKEMGTMEILLVSPLKAKHIILGKVAPYLLLSIVDAIVVVLLGNIVFGVPIRGSIFVLAFLVILYIMMALSLGILISTVANSQQVALFISGFALMLPTMLLSGFIFPIENMPVPLQILSNLMPPKWFIDALKQVMLKGNGFTYIWPNILILSAMTAFFLLLSVKKFRLRLE